MNLKKLLSFIDIKEGEDFSFLKAIDFENLICTKLLKFGKVERQVKVKDRYDGRRGRLDIVFEYLGEKYAIEIDRMTPRNKSLFKVKHYNKNIAFVILRAPYKVIAV